MSPQAVRPLALTAMVGGALYVIAGLVQLTSPEQSDPFSRMSDYLIEAVLALSLLLTLAGFVALHLLLRAGGYRGLRGSTGFRAAVLGQGAMLASTVASLIAGAPALGFLYFAGTLVLLVGLALLSVATHRAALLPGWSPYLVGALAVGVLGGFGMVVVGVVWITLGYVLRSLRGGGPVSRALRNYSRIRLPRASVNKGREKGQCTTPRPLDGSRSTTVPILW